MVIRLLSSDHHLNQVKLDLGSSRLDQAKLQVGCLSCLLYDKSCGWCQKSQGLNLDAKPQTPCKYLAHRLVCEPLATGVWL